MSRSLVPFRSVSALDIEKVGYLGHLLALICPLSNRRLSVGMYPRDGVFCGTQHSPFPVLVFENESASLLSPRHVIVLDFTSIHFDGPVGKWIVVSECSQWIRRYSIHMSEGWENERGKVAKQRRHVHRVVLMFDDPSLCTHQRTKHTFDLPMVGTDSVVWYTVHDALKGVVVMPAPEISLVDWEDV